MSLAEETARDVIIDALDDISVHMDEGTLGASDARTGLKGINRIMATLLANGVDLGFTKLEHISDSITIPEGAVDALVSLLAYRLWPKYRTPQPSIEVLSNARSGTKQLYRMGVTVTASEYSGNLPTGSGNSQPGDTYDTFYTDSDDTDTDTDTDSIWDTVLSGIWDETLDSIWGEV